MDGTVNTLSRLHDYMCVVLAVRKVGLEMTRARRKLTKSDENMGSWINDLYTKSLEC